ncbi:FAD dependent oxidoreductase [Martensiomyces pterosporus]|nr:FAD dependent oxidoreductase [Martensiomyces pterosporus]
MDTQNQTSSTNGTRIRLAAALDGPGLPLCNPTTSTWLHHLPSHFAQHHGPRKLPASADVVIIGSGLSGASTAYHLCQELGLGTSKRILMLEARDACSGATGRNGGHLTSPNYRDFLPDDWSEGRRMTVELRQFDDEGVKRTIEFAMANSVDCGYRLGKNIQVYETPEEWEQGLSNLRAARDAGIVGADVLTQEQMREVLGTDKCCGATYIPGAHIFPARLVWHLLDRAIEAGLELHVRSPVTKVDAQYSALVGADCVPEAYVVSVGRHGGGGQEQTVLAKHVVHATNAWASHLLPELRGHIVPYRDQLLAIPRDPSGGPGLTLPAAGLWIDNGAEYAIERSMGSGRLVVGGFIANDIRKKQFGNSDDTQLIEGAGAELRQAIRTVPLLRLFPCADLERADVHEWTGIIGVSNDHVPFVGDLTQVLLDGKCSEHDVHVGRVFVNAGHCGEGMPRCFRLGRHIAQKVGLLLGKRIEEGEIEDVPGAMTITLARLGSLDFH